MKLLKSLQFELINAIDIDSRTSRNAKLKLTHNEKSYNQLIAQITTAPSAHTTQHERVASKKKKKKTRTTWPKKYLCTLIHLHIYTTHVCVSVCVCTYVLNSRILFFSVQ